MEKMHQAGTPKAPTRGRPRASARAIRTTEHSLAILAQVAAGTYRYYSTRGRKRDRGGKFLQELKR